MQSLCNCGSDLKTVQDGVVVSTDYLQELIYRQSNSDNSDE